MGSFLFDFISSSCEIFPGAKNKTFLAGRSGNRNAYRFSNDVFASKLQVFSQFMERFLPGATDLNSKSKLFRSIAYDGDGKRSLNEFLDKAGYFLPSSS